MRACLAISFQIVGAAAKKKSSGKDKGSKSKRGHGGVREEIKQLQEALGVDDLLEGYLS